MIGRARTGSGESVEYSKLPSDIRSAHIFDNLKGRRLRLCRVSCLLSFLLAVRLLGH